MLSSPITVLQPETDYPSVSFTSHTTSSLHQRRTSCEELLTEVLLTFQNPDVYKFLFTRENIHAPYFTVPVLSRSSLVARVRSSCCEIQEERHQSISEECSGSVIYTPAFSIGTINLGFGFHQCIHKSSPDGLFGCRQHVVNSTARYVMDDSVNTFTTVFHAPELNVLGIAYKRAHSPTKHTRICAFFDREKFMRLFDMDVLTATNLRGPLQRIQAGIETRTCPYCQGCSETCSCSVASPESKHPFDRQKFINSMALQLGEFSGTSNLSLLQNGKRVKEARMKCRTSVQPTKDLGEIELIQRIAVSNVSGDNVITPHALLASQSRERLLTEAVPKEKSLSPEEEAAFECLVDDLSNETGNEPPLKNDMERDVPLYEQDNREDSTANVKRKMIESSMDSENAQLAELMNLHANLYSVDSSRHLSECKEPYSQRALKTPGSSRGRQINSVKEYERIIKLEMRKQRNRASARRSNQKKKAENDALKLLIKQEKGKIENLRIKEVQLRQANLRLRHMLASNSRT